MRLRRQLIYPALVGGLYAALTALLSPLSYGAVQCRLSEALCVLPFFLPETAWGLALGCALANTLSAAGLLDVVFGALATLLAGLCTAALGRPWRETGRWPGLGRQLAACAMPVLWNGVTVGAVLAASLLPRSGFWEGALLFGAEVALGESAAMLCAGLPLLRLLRRVPELRRHGSGTADTE